VYLPAGNWYPLFGGAPVAGGQSIDVNVPMGEIPVYALAGAVIPNYPDGVQTLTVEPSNAKNALGLNDRVVWAYAGAAGSFTEKDGLQYTLTSSPTSPSTDTITATFAGSPLPACASTPVAPCFQQNADNGHAYLIGSGSLVLTRSNATLAQLDVKSAAQNAQIQAVIRF
jgi:hypothetical protein